MSALRLNALQNLSADLRILLGGLDDGIVFVDREALILNRLGQRIMGLGLREIAVSTEIAMRASDLSNLTGDPFDRVIVGTALVEGAVLLTADESLLDWPGQLRRQDAAR